MNEPGPNLWECACSHCAIWRAAMKASMLLIQAAASGMDENAVRDMAARAELPRVVWDQIHDTKAALDAMGFARAGYLSQSDLPRREYDGRFQVIDAVAVVRGYTSAEARSFFVAGHAEATINVALVDPNTTLSPVVRELLQMTLRVINASRLQR